MKRLLEYGKVGVAGFVAIALTSGAADDVLSLRFQRLAARRFVFSQNIPLAELAPAETVAFTSMHPAFLVSSNDTPMCDAAFVPALSRGHLELNGPPAGRPVCIYVGAVNPFASYDVAIEELTAPAADVSAEVAIDLARHGLRDRVQAVARAGAEAGLFLRVWQGGRQVREIRFSSKIPECPFVLRAQLSGRNIAVFTETDGVTAYHGHTDDSASHAKAGKQHFGDVLDFRRRETARQSTFNVLFNGQGHAVLRSARAYLSAGMGQVDIRAVTYEDLTPFLENGRLWFTFSMRGIALPHPSQGVFSLDPSVFDLRFEGAIAFDFGDGLLRNAVASHLFYDRSAAEWRAFSSDFGGSSNREGRAESQLFRARSAKDPRRGFSVMRAALIPNTQLAGRHEDPSIFYDKSAGKWRLLTSTFTQINGQGNITASLHEADTWDGAFTTITPPIGANATGTTLARMGNTVYALMGGHGNLRAHAYPSLAELGEIRMDFQPHWPKPAGRVWADIVPLPEGYPHRYVLLTMDRANFPEVKPPTWSYGALYLYGADEPQP
ncbi:MAG TPA: hypothetical protein P5026_13785 [Kiritimatiellia bacterium]|nr:hypothetical protein [Kiritimatiellia bacterium]HRU71182.1 hypothetical protein [Kiritimatiellia bacterium]